MSNEIMIRMEQIVKTYYIGQPNELEIQVLTQEVQTLRQQNRGWIYAFKSQSYL